jgi:redox-regulated HSP33 family molecular chaperone
MTARKALKFLLDSMPSDDSKFTSMRETLTNAISICNELLDKLSKEEHEAISRITRPGDSCACKSCKTEQFIEVIQSLSKDELLEIVASEFMDETYKVDCTKKTDTGVAETKEEAKEEVKPAGGAGVISHC